MTSTPARGGAQDHKRARRNIPSSADPSALSVSDGIIHVGWIVPSDGSFFAFDFTGSLVGAFPTQAEAANALPYATAMVGEA